MGIMTIRVRPISVEEREILGRWERADNVVRYRRARVLLLSEERWKCPRIAEALGLTPNELFTESHDEGKTVVEIAEERGVDLSAVKDTLDARRAEARQEAIQQAVEDGRITQEQADWMLEGIEQGYGLGFGGRGMGRGGHFGMGPGQGLFGPCALEAEES